MTVLLIQILAILKDNFERVIFWLILVVFLFLSVRLGMQWGHNEEIGMSLEAEFGLEQRYNPAVLNKDIPKEETLGASAGLFTKKPILYYRDFYKRNAFSSVPGLKIKEELVMEKKVEKKIKPATKYEYIGVIDIGGRLVATIKNKSTGEEFYVGKGELVENLKVLDITKTYMLLSDEDKKKDIRIEINK
ncbi:MAG: hypothetical protein Q7J67_10100 [bacterium]|nr:hypothetical protein [bacterium]